MANLSSNEALELARWWLKGQSVGSKPLFDGICSMCGTLLHDLSNGHRGDPVNRDGNPLLKPSGEPDVDAQPPFLLRFSPAFFAKEIPSIFQHDPATNSLVLPDGVDAPWIADQVQTDGPNESKIQKDGPKLRSKSKMTDQDPKPWVGKEGPK